MANNRGFLKRKATQRNGHARVDFAEVARVAYGLYEQRGRVHGHDVEDWLNAEQLVKQQNASPAALVQSL